MWARVRGRAVLALLRSEERIVFRQALLVYCATAPAPRLRAVAIRLFKATAFNLGVADAVLNQMENRFLSRHPRDMN